MTRFISFIRMVVISVLTILVIVGCGDDDKVVKQEEEEQYADWVMRTGWHVASKPAGQSDSRLRAFMYWFNPYNRISVDQIWDEEYDPGSSQRAAHTLWLVLDPGRIDRRWGNVAPDAEITEPSLSWNGVMRYVPPEEIDLGTVNWLQMRINGRKGIMHVEFGRMAEDINGNGDIDSEDRFGGTIDYLDEGEDIGLDGMTDNEERAYFNEPTNPDPSGDNWVNYDPDTAAYYHKINGCQGDSLDPGCQGKPSKEDVNGNGVLDIWDNYLSFTIDLSDGSDTSNFYIYQSENMYGWRSFAIPIRSLYAVDTVVGDTVKALEWNHPYVRIWLESPAGEECIVGIAAMDFCR